MLGGMLNGEIPTAHGIQNKLRRTGGEAVGIFRADEVEDLPVLFQYV
jgi:hypothetical protein